LFNVVLGGPMKRPGGSIMRRGCSVVRDELVEVVQFGGEGLNKEAVWLRGKTRLLSC
jgi:hypothetical protein